MSSEIVKLEEIFAEVIAGRGSRDCGGIEEQCQVIVDHQDTSKGVLAVLLTLMLKKECDPIQDIRLHQDGMEDGFSGRGLDERVVTPFLGKNSFPYMKSGSGWLTRSLEQAHPYNLEYPGRITPKIVKSSFLEIIDTVENKDLSPGNIIRYIISGLVQRRDRITSLELSRPVGLTIREIVEKIELYNETRGKISSKLPVLAIYVMLKFVVREMERYESCDLLELKSHTAADEKTGLIGDINIVYRDSKNIFESYEIKHNLEITEQMLDDSARKIYGKPIQRYYLITTAEYCETQELREKIFEIENSHNCELILGNLTNILGNYLQLISNAEWFIHDYVDQIRSDDELTYEIKIAWNDIA